MDNPFKRLRKEKKLTGLEMSLILGINPTYYYEIENGFVKLSKPVLNTLKEKFGIEPDTFKKEFDEWREKKLKEILNKEG